MLEPVANIKTLLIEGSCSPITWFTWLSQNEACVKRLKNSMGDIMTSLIPTHMSVSKLISEYIHSKAFIYRILIFTDLFHGNVGMAGVL